MSTEGFTFDTDSGLWLADGFEGINWADGSETYLRQVFDEARTVSDYPVDLAGAIRDWPSRYHLSHTRVNFLEALRSLFDPSWTALELGGGTGVLTKWLAQTVARLDVLEGSIERAHVNRIRTRDDSNVRVFVGDMVATPFPDVYDLVTLIGVLEYTPAQPDSNRRQACLTLLQKIRGSMAQDGVLMLAIENRLGAKYWTGCTEDHSSRMFDGIVGYPDDTPITFSRHELEALLRDAGFEHQQFYHLHPDYKLPTTVVRETRLPKEISLHQWMTSFAEDYAHRRKYFVPDPLLMKSVENAGLLWHFSNSFLVLCSPSPKPRLAEDWLAKKFSNSLRPELHHVITLAERSGSIRVEREPLREGKSTIDLGEYRFELSHSDYTPGSLLMVEAYTALMSWNWFERLSILCQELLELAHSCLPAVPTPQHGPFEMLDGAALDLTFWNVIRRDDGSLVFFDRKWTAARPVPADYVLFRCLLWLQWDVSPVLGIEVRETIVRLLAQLWPEFDCARFEAHLREEDRLQKCVHADLQSRLPLGADGHLGVPWSDGYGGPETLLPLELRIRMHRPEDAVMLLLEVLDSTSWRLTRPMRAALDVGRRAGEKVRKLFRPTAG